MKNATLNHLVRSLSRCSGTSKHVYAKLDGDRIVFTGGSQGEHSLCVSVSSRARILAHWEGYCESNGLAPKPKVGQRVCFPSRSAPCGYRYGRVVSVGSVRATIAYRFYAGHEAVPAALPIRCLEF